MIDSTVRLMPVSSVRLREALQQGDWLLWVGSRRNRKAAAGHKRTFVNDKSGKVTPMRIFYSPNRRDPVALDSEEGLHWLADKLRAMVAVRDGQAIAAHARGSPRPYDELLEGIRVRRKVLPSWQDKAIVDVTNALRCACCGDRRLVVGQKCCAGFHGCTSGQGFPPSGRCTPGSGSGRPWWQVGRISRKR
jgi:hypothetical protein